jgi:hypothetical protein
MSTLSLDPAAAPAAAVPAERFAVLRGKLPVPWVLAVALAVVMAFADMFWLTSLQGAVGAIERAQGPFHGWLRDSSILAPFFFLAVLWVFARAERKRAAAPARRSRFRTTVATGLLLAAAGSVVGVAAVVASGTYDYHLQSELLQSTASLHDHSLAGPGGATANPAYADGGWTPEQRQTIALDVKAAAFGSGLIVVTNLVAVSWVIALAGGRVDAKSTRRTPAKA